MSDTLVVRPVRSEELEAVGALTLAAYRTLPEFEATDPDNYSQKLLDARSRAETAEVFVALDKGRLVGCVTYVGDTASPMAEWDEPNSAGFRMLAVAPDAQGLGVGRCLTTFCIERARSDGKAALILHSSHFMHGAQGLYRSLGFQRHEAIDFEVPPVRLLGYRLALQ